MQSDHYERHLLPFNGILPPVNEAGRLVKSSGSDFLMSSPTNLIFGTHVHLCQGHVSRS